MPTDRNASDGGDTFWRSSDGASTMLTGYGPSVTSPIATAAAAPPIARPVDTEAVRPPLRHMIPS
jgi:hypothetical protein